MTRMKALLAGSAIAAVTALSFAAVSAAPGQAPSGDEAAAARPGYHHMHKVRGEGHGGRGHHARDCGARAGGYMERQVNVIEGLMEFSPEQKAASQFFESFWEARGWGLGVSVMTSRAEVAGVPGRFGWDGAFGGSWYVDPREDLVGVLMTQVRPGALRLPPVVLDFWTSIYQAIDD